MRIIFLLIGILMVSCSPELTRFGYQKPYQMKNPEYCKVSIVVNDSSLNDLKPLARGKFSDNGFITNCSEYEIINLIKNEACNLGANVVNLVHPKPPGFGSTCFQTYYDIYYIKDYGKDTSKKQIIEEEIQNENSKIKTEKKPNTNTSLHNNRLVYITDSIKIKENFIEISGLFGFGGTTSGSRLDIVRAEFTPPPDGLNPLVYGIKLAYHQYLIGAEFQFNYMELSAVKTNYEPMTVYNDLNYLALMQISPYTYKDRTYWLNFYLHGGLVYNTFSFSDNVSGGFTEKASGMGYLVGAGMDFLEDKLIAGFSIDYEAKKAKFEISTDEYTLNNLIFRAYIGLKIDL